MKILKPVFISVLTVLLFSAYGCNNSSSDSTKDSTSTSVQTDTSSAMHDTSKMMKDTMPAMKDSGTKGDQPLPPKN